MDARRALAIALGAMVGASMRWGLASLLGAGAIDVALLVANVAGCLALGALGALSEAPGPGPTRSQRAFLGAGLCGSLTTWSSLALESATDLRAGAYAQATVWPALHLVAGIGAAVAGRALARSPGRGHGPATGSDGPPPGHGPTAAGGA